MTKLRGLPIDIFGGRSHLACLSLTQSGTPPSEKADIQEREGEWRRAFAASLSTVMLGRALTFVLLSLVNTKYR
jgi:hypothetical protein